MISFNPNIFRKYDIRGIADTDLTPDFVRLLGRAFGSMIKRRGGQRIAIGRDCRHSGIRLSEDFSAGLLETGINVVNLGLVSTPMVYFASYTLPIDGAVSITGSHNPSDWNGFKFCAGTASVYGDAIQTLREMIQASDFEVGEGLSENSDILPTYLDALASRLNTIEKPISVVIDAGNGTGGIAAGELYRRMGATVHELYCEPDGNFPNHHPDPTVEKNLTDLIERVQTANADFGIAFDGDADRIGAIDQRGRMIWGDQLLTLFGLDILKTQPGARMVGEVKCSKVMYDTLRQAGANIEMWKVGHSLIKARMKETGAVLAGEMSGHLFFKDRFFGFDDAVYAGGRLIELVARSPRGLDDLMDSLPQTYVTPEIRVPCSDSEKFEVTEKAAAHFSERYSVSLIDGVRVEFEEGWGLIRASNTQPVLVVRVEATSEQRRDQYLSEINNWLYDEAPEVVLDAKGSHK
ncbi:MAG: phosphomannomutase/phosphoglucomutase [Myxococcota bacterium]|nr:phosphomannomutase/phosphoglucomutase [Myxococcota bacterium]